MPSYLTGLFENLMEGGEDAASTAMVVEGERRAGRGRDGRRTDTDRQTGQGSVQIQERGLQLQAGGASKRLFCYSAENNTGGNTSGGAGAHLQFPSEAHAGKRRRTMLMQMLLPLELLHKRSFHCWTITVFFGLSGTLREMSFPGLVLDLVQVTFLLPPLPYR